MVKVAQLIGAGAGFEPSDMRLQNWVCKDNPSGRVAGEQRGEAGTQSLPKGQMSVLSPETDTEERVSPSGRGARQRARQPQGSGASVAIREMPVKTE